MLKERIDEMEKNNDCLHKEMDTLRTQYDELKTITGERITTITDDLQLEMTKRQEVLAELEHDIQDKETQIKEVNTFHHRFSSRVCLSLLSLK